MQTQHKSLQSMGTRLDLVFPGLEAHRCEKVMETIQSELVRLEAKLSYYSPESEISRINNSTGDAAILLDSELRSIFKDLFFFHKETAGFFDVTMKPVYEFHQAHPEKNLALPDSLRDIVGMNLMELLESGIHFKKEGLQIDLGGYAKGYAVKRLVQILESAQIERALISFGESLIYGLGTHPYGDSWKINIPVGAYSNPIVFTLKDEALSTSGNTLNNRKKFANSGHIVNPVTLTMRRSLGLVMVKSKDPVRAEVFSTALYSSGKSISKEILDRNSDLEVQWLSFAE